MKFETRSKNIHTDLASKLLHARSQVHIYHLQTKSYAQHKALNELYDSILEGFDEFVETVQGKTSSILTGYQTINYLEDDNPVSYLLSLKNDIQSYRDKISGKEWSNIDNQMQVIIDHIEQAIYKLTFLK